MKNPREFCYWLQGFFELYDGDSLTDFQLNRIKQELDKVFTHPTVEPPPSTVPYIPPYTGVPSGGVTYPPNFPQINEVPFKCGTGLGMKPLLEWQQSHNT